MDNEHQHRNDGNHTQTTLFRSKWVLIGFLLVVGYFLFTEHKAHVVAFLPYALLLACPLMHIFMHGGHGRHHDKHTKDGKEGGS